jgi:hypothetical protein
VGLKILQKWQIERHPHDALLVLLSKDAKRIPANRVMIIQKEKGNTGPISESKEKSAVLQISVTSGEHDTHLRALNSSNFN